MLAYLVRRLILAVLTSLAVSVLAYVVIELPPGDYITSYIAQMSSSGSFVSAQEAEALRQCSAMGQHFLGETFDIHGGGADLIFPHHENEIAQAEGATGKPFVRYWIHNGFVTINQEKMSKSLKNFSTIREILGYCHPEAVRLFLLSNHYRSPVDFSEQSLREAQQALDRLYALLKDLKEMKGEIKGSPAAGTKDMEEIVRSLPEQFENAMDDDFNTAAALGVLQRTTRDLNRLFAEVKQDDSVGFPAKLREEGLNTFVRLGAVLGVLTSDPSEYFRQKQDEGSEGYCLERGAAP